MVNGKMYVNTTRVWIAISEMVNLTPFPWPTLIEGSNKE